MTSWKLRYDAPVDNERRRSSLLFTLTGARTGSRKKDFTSARHLDRQFSDIEAGTLLQVAVLRRGPVGSCRRGPADGIGRI
jgi:hypothetical protein